MEYLDGLSCASGLFNRRSSREDQEYCEKALELDIKEICFTTHVELDPAQGYG